MINHCAAESLSSTCPRVFDGRHRCWYRQTSRMKPWPTASEASLPLPSLQWVKGRRFSLFVFPERHYLEAPQHSSCFLFKRLSNGKLQKYRSSFVCCPELCSSCSEASRFTKKWQRKQRRKKLDSSTSSRAIQLPATRGRSAAGNRPGP